MSSRLARALRLLALPVIVVVAALLAASLHRNGHTQGDDFALYLAQARSLFDGDPGAVIDDNRFAVVNSDSGFSPIGYPWGWPLILSPFVFLWGVDYERLKLVEVGLFCLWLVLMHGIVRRRLGRIVALGVVAVLGTAPAYLEHTEQLITEIPHLAAVTVFVWWLDRVRERSTLLAAPIGRLAILGVAGAAAFNIRREGIVLILVVAAMQFVELVRTRADERDETTGDSPWRPLREIVDLARSQRDALISPHAAFIASVIGFQLLLPTTLFPDNGNGPAFIDNRVVEFAGILTDQLGLGNHPVLGVVMLAIAAAGAFIGVRRRPHLDGPLLVLALLSALTVSTHFRTVERYWFQVTPWVLYFGTVAILAVVHRLVNERDRLAPALALAPLGVLVIVHAAVLPTRIADVRDLDASGGTLYGPTATSVEPVYEAVRELTPPDAVVSFLRARTMTFLTDRRSFQTKDFDRIALGADYLAQRRRESAWQPGLDTVRDSEFEEVWSDANWILWRVPDPD